MALTRRSLKELGLDAQTIDSIIEMHADTVNALRTELDHVRTQNAELPALREKYGAVEQELQTLRSEDWKGRHDQVRRELDQLLESQRTEHEHQARCKAARAYFSEHGISGDNLELAMRGSSAEIDALTLQDDAIADTSALDRLMDGPFSRLVSSVCTVGAATPRPPVNCGGFASKEEIMRIRDREQRRAAIAANMNLFEKGD